MRFIEQLPPGARPCAVIPGRQKDPNGFIDTGNELVGFDPHIYCSYEGVKQMALRMGFVEGDIHKQIVDDLEMRIALTGRELEETRDELARTDGLIDAIDTLESANFRARKKPGRPKAKEAA
jgi:hypothetical protein